MLLYTITYTSVVYPIIEHVAVGHGTLHPPPRTQAGGVVAGRINRIWCPPASPIIATIILTLRETISFNISFMDTQTSTRIIMYKASLRGSSQVV